MSLQLEQVFVDPLNNGAAAGAFIKSGSLRDIDKSGVYYVANAVTDKPTETGGLYILARVDDINGVAIFASASGNDLYIIHQPNSNNPRVSKIAGTSFSG